MAGQRAFLLLVIGIYSLLASDVTTQSSSTILPLTTLDTINVTTSQPRNLTSSTGEEDDNNLLHEELNVLLTELRQVAEAIESVRKEHSRLAKGVGEISSAVKDMNIRSEHIRKKVKKMSKTINKNTHHHKLKDTLKSLQKDHQHILKAVTAMSSKRKSNHDSGQRSGHKVNSKGNNNKDKKDNKKEKKEKNDNKPRSKKDYQNTTIESSEVKGITTVTPVTTVTQNEKDNSIPELVVEPQEEKKAPVKPPRPLPRDCTEVGQRGNFTSGVYRIHPKGLQDPIKVWCDHTTSGGGWTVMVARLQQEKQQDFNLKWEDYKKGFGDPAKEHWIGTEPMHLMTKDKRHELRVNITDWNDAEAYAEWKDFRVESEDKGYALTVGRYGSSSTAGDALKWHDGMKFSTPDRDNDALMGGHCAYKNSGGWWYRGYRGCYQAHPTGKYQKNPPKLPPAPSNSSRRNFDLGPVLAWQNWRGESYFPKRLFLMFRPVF